MCAKFFVIGCISALWSVHTFSEELVINEMPKPALIAQNQTSSSEEAIRRFENSETVVISLKALAEESGLTSHLLHRVPMLKYISSNNVLDPLITVRLEKIHTPETYESIQVSIMY